MPYLKYTPYGLYGTGNLFAHTNYHANGDTKIPNRVIELLGNGLSFPFQLSLCIPNFDSQLHSLSQLYNIACNHLLSTSVDAVPEDDLSLRVGQVPDARRTVPRPGGEQVLHRVPRADENLLVVSLEHARLLLRDLHPLVDRQLKQDGMD